MVVEEEEVEGNHGGGSQSGEKRVQPQGYCGRGL